MFKRLLPYSDSTKKTLTSITKNSRIATIHVHHWKHCKHRQNNMLLVTRNKYTSNVTLGYIWRVLFLIQCISLFFKQWMCSAPTHADTGLDICRQVPTNKCILPNHCYKNQTAFPTLHSTLQTTTTPVPQHSCLNPSQTAYTQHPHTIHTNPALHTLKCACNIHSCHDTPWSQPEYNSRFLTRITDTKTNETWHFFRATSSDCHRKIYTSR